MPCPWHTSGRAKQYPRFPAHGAPPRIFASRASRWRFGPVPVWLRLSHARPASGPGPATGVAALPHPSIRIVPPGQIPPW